MGSISAILARFSSHPERAQSHFVKRSEHLGKFVMSLVLRFKSIAIGLLHNRLFLISSIVTYMPDRIACLHSIFIHCGRILTCSTNYLASNGNASQFLRFVMLNIYNNLSFHFCDSYRMWFSSIKYARSPTFAYSDGASSMYAPLN